MQRAKVKKEKKNTVKKKATEDVPTTPQAKKKRTEKSEQKLDEDLEKNKFPSNFMKAKRGFLEALSSNKVSLPQS